MAPPCVPFFEGNNFGSTWPGVTKDEIRVVLWSGYGNGGTTGQTNTHCTTISPTATCTEGPRPRQLCDLDKPPNTDPNCFIAGRNDDFWLTKIIRALGRHFDRRYQTYDRHVHFYIWFTNSSNAQTQRAEAADVYERLQPFASIGFNNHWTDAMAGRKVSSFGGGSGGFQDSSLFTKNAPYLWGWGPDIQHWVRSYADYVCTKLPGTTVSHADGTDIDGKPLMGQPRRYAFMHTTDASEPQLHRFRDLVRPMLADCGITPTTEVTFPFANYIVTSGGEDEARLNVAEMRQKRINTILWFGGLENQTGKFAAQEEWFPEIVFAGDGGDIDGVAGGQSQDQIWWGNAYGITEALYRGASLEEDPGFQACKEGDPEVTRDECQHASDNYFRNIFMLFKAIQAAGPRLSPRTIDRGMHSLPSIRSTSPWLASCFFEPGDYTCVKDRVEEWWDPDADNPFHSAPGCQRLSLGGERFLPGNWPREDTAMKNESDPCSAVIGSGSVGIFIDPT